MEEKNKSECCSTSPSGKSGCGCCCGAKKFIVGLLLGALLFGAGYCIAKNCGGSKMCPVSQQMMQK